MSELTTIFRSGENAETLNRNSRENCRSAHSFIRSPYSMLMRINKHRIPERSRTERESFSFLRLPSYISRVSRRHSQCDQLEDKARDANSPCPMHFCRFFLSSSGSLAIINFTEQERTVKSTCDSLQLCFVLASTRTNFRRDLFTLMLSSTETKLFLRSLIFLYHYSGINKERDKTILNDF